MERARAGALRMKFTGWFRHETVLLLLVILEWLCFNRLGPHFGSLDNTFDIIRHSTEIGLLALVMTPIILTGGIDLSVGSLLGLSAIVFGKLWRDAGLSPATAGVCTLCMGGLAGGLNALLITQLRLPPLIVTLGTYSLFRGLAEAITRGVDTFTNFPASFLFLGQERWLGMPAQTPVFITVAAGIWLLVHRTAFGRSLRAIGFAPEGARYAGIPVERRIGLLYVLAGVVSALAAIIYTARLGQARGRCRDGLRIVRHNCGGARRHEHIWRHRLGAWHAAGRGGHRGVEQRACSRPSAARSGRHAHGRAAVGRVGRFRGAQAVFRPALAILPRLPNDRALKGNHAHPSAWRYAFGGGAVGLSWARNQRKHARCASRRNSSNTIPVPKRPCRSLRLWR